MFDGNVFSRYGQDPLATRIRFFPCQRGIGREFPQVWPPVREIGSDTAAMATLGVILIAFSAENSILRPLGVGFVRAPDVGIELARLVIIAVLAAGLSGVLSAPTADPAAALILEAQPADLAAPPSPFAKAEARPAQPHSIDPAATWGAPDPASQADSIGGWFDETELKLSETDDKFDVFVDPSACIYPDSFLRTLAGGRDNCSFLKPGTDESEVLTLPFLALSGWVLVISGVAALHYYHRNWRVRRWLRRMQAKGLAPSGASPRRSSQGRPRRSSRRDRAGSRRYAG